LIDTKKVDAFFKNRKKEANIPRAVLAFIAAMLFLSTALALSDFQSHLDLAFNQQALFSMPDNISYYFILIPTILFIPAIIANWLLGKYLFKSKARLAEVIYIPMIAFLSLPAAFIARSIAELIIPDFLGFMTTGIFTALAFVSFYLLIVAIKTVHGIKETDAVVNLISTQIAAGPLQIAFFLGYVLMMTSTPIHYEMNQVNNSDGTMTASFAYVYDSSGEPREICYVTVPQGWKLADEEAHATLEEKIKANITTRAVFYKDENEFLFFDIGLPRKAHSSSGSTKCTEERSYYDENWFGKNFDPDYGTYEVGYILSKENLIEGCDAKALNNNKTTIRHILSGHFMGDMISFSTISQFPAGEDDDLYFIIENMHCYG